jgi:hypothetical protein
MFYQVFYVLYYESIIQLLVHLLFMLKISQQHYNWINKIGY